MVAPPQSIQLTVIQGLPQAVGTTMGHEQTHPLSAQALRLCPQCLRGAAISGEAVRMGNNIPCGSRAQMMLDWDTNPFSATRLGAQHIESLGPLSSQAGAGLWSTTHCLIGAGCTHDLTRPDDSFHLFASWEGS